MHADRETETVGGRVNGGGRLACIEKKGGGRLPGTWALTLTRPKTGGWALTQEWALTRDTTVYICTAILHVEIYFVHAGFVQMKLVGRC